MSKARLQNWKDHAGNDVTEVAGAPVKKADGSAVAGTSAEMSKIGACTSRTMVLARTCVADQQWQRVWPEGVTDEIDAAMSCRLRSA